MLGRERDRVRTKVTGVAGTGRVEGEREDGANRT